MSIDEKVIVHSRPEAIPTQPTHALLDVLLAPALADHNTVLPDGANPERDEKLDGVIRSAIYALPWA